MTNQIKLILFWSSVLVIYSVFFLLEYFVWSKTDITFFSLKIDKGELAFYIQILYTLVSIRIVWANELGGRFIFGKSMNNLSPGLVFIPIGFCSMGKETGRALEDELPADPHLVFRVKLGEPEVIPAELIAQGYVPPIRITFAFPKGEETADPLNSRLTAEVVIVIRWRVTDYLQFFRVIGDIKEARRQLNDIAINTLFPILSKLTVSDALKNLKKVNKRLEKVLDDVMSGKGDKDRPWGAQLETAAVKSISQSHDLNDKIEEVAKAKLEKEKRRLEGEGTGASEKAILIARTAGLKKMTEDLEISPGAVLGAEVSRAITNNPGQKTFIAGSGGFKDIVSVAAIAGEAFTSSTKKEDEE